MTIINLPSLPFIRRILSILRLLQSLVPLLLILSFSITHVLHLILLLLFLPLQSQFRSPLVTILSKPRVLSPTKGFRMKYPPPPPPPTPQGAQAFLSTLPFPNKSDTDRFLTYLDNINTDYYTGIINCCDSWALVFQNPM